MQTRSQRTILIASAAIVLACGPVRPTSPEQPGVAPPASDSEGVQEVTTPAGRAAARLIATPQEIDRSGHVTLRVENSGQVALGYGRPITVERWEDDQWRETRESREAAWTMELLLVGPGERGVEQRWPFVEGRRPEPGWYRFTKQIYVEDASGTRERLVVRARARVLE